MRSERKDNSKRKSRSIWIPDETYEAISALAAKEQRSFSFYVERLLYQHLQMIQTTED